MSITTAVVTYARLVRELHELIARGLGDSPEAEALAEQMDEPWYAMTEEEQRRMRELSAQLFAVRKGGPKRVDMPTGSDTPTGPRSSIGKPT